MAAKSNPALTYTLEDFIEEGRVADEMTYIHFCVTSKDKDKGVDFVQYNIIDMYIDELLKVCEKIYIKDITFDQKVRYKYHPDLLAFDIYGSTQLDFIVLLCNGIIDPKEFDFEVEYLLLPKASVLNAFLSKIYNADHKWLATSNDYF